MRQFANNRRVLVAGLGAIALVAALGACGSSATGPAAESTLAFPPGTATPGFVPNGSAAPLLPASGMPSMPGMPTATTASAPVRGTAVAIQNFAFAPATLSVKVGTTVTWTNRDEEPHTVSAQNGSFHSPGMGTGATYSFTFTHAGSVDYVCTIHPFMHGTVVVTP
ncbi:amicyanin [Nocardia sp. GAS34]|uniref:cupredoxin domain-containing protein n=1 Tax=unclassified Nocardia TaxID=2637762 RepID=UPI003D1E6EB7